MKVINLGTYTSIRDEEYHTIGYKPVSFDTGERELWLYKMQHVYSEFVGNSNYTSDYIEKYNLIFHINSGKGEGKSCRASEEYYCILQIEFASWYRPVDMLEKELLKVLEPYPIIYTSEVLSCFRVRGFFKHSEIIKIEEHETNYS